MLGRGFSPIHLRRLLGVALCGALALAAAPATAHADAAEESLELARAGAGHFKEKRYIEAARAAWRCWL